MRVRVPFCSPSAITGLVLVVVGCLGSTPASALASGGEAAASQTYAQANYALVRVARSHLAASEAAPLAVLAKVRRECPLAAKDSPQDPESTQLSDEVIGAMVIGAAQPDLRAIRAFIRTVAPLRWSDGRLTAAVHAYAGKLKTVIGLGAPNLCGDVEAWAASGYRALPSSTVAFVGKFMPAWVALGYVPSLLSRDAGAAASGLLRRAAPLEQQLTEGEARAVEHWGDIMNALELSP